MPPRPPLAMPSRSPKSDHPAPMVTKIRGVGVPSTSSTKYVPGASCSSAVLGSARGGGGANGTVTVGEGWSAGVPSSREDDEHADDDHDDGSGGDDEARPAATAARLGRCRFVLDECHHRPAPRIEVAEVTGLPGRVEIGAQLGDPAGTRCRFDRRQPLDQFALSDMIATPTRAQALACS